MIVASRTALCCAASVRRVPSSLGRGRHISDASPISDKGEGHDRLIIDDYATLRPHYDVPKYPIVLAHGLLGFDVLRVGRIAIPGIQYWKGIADELESRGATVITTAVPPYGSIESRAARLGEEIAQKASDQSVNIIAFVDSILSSQIFTDESADIACGLDARYMVSRLRPQNVDVRSLTTIASPHRGSMVADYIFDNLGPVGLPRLFKKLEMEAFSQLTQKYMHDHFNPETPDVDGIRYYSFGASYQPSWWSTFRQFHDIMERLGDAPNDGLVSVPSSKWGEYKGTLVGASHLDIINWTNWNIRFWELVGFPKKFNAIAFYLDIADMLAKEGL